MAAKKATKKRASKQRGNPLYAYQVSVIQPGAPAKALGGFPAHSRADALKMAETELRRKGQWSGKTKLITAAVPLSSTAARHKNKTVIKAGRIDHLDVSKVHNGRRRHAEHRDAKHPIHVRQYWQGRKGYKTQWQRAHEAGQGQLFKVKNARGTKRNPTLPGIKLRAPEAFKTLAEAIKQRKAVARVEARVSKAGAELLKQYRAIDAEITAIARQGTPSQALRAKYRTAEGRSSRAQLLKGKLNVYLEKLDRHIASFKRQAKRNPRRNSGTAEANRREFAGAVTGYQQLYFPEGTPQGLSTLGPLVLLETDAGTIAPTGGKAVLCQDAAGKLYIGATQNAPLIDGAARSFGKVRRVEYICAKPHLGYPGKVTWFHDFENPLPSLKSDGRGGLHFHGGGYTIRREGITG